MFNSGSDVTPYSVKRHDTLSKVIRLENSRVQSDKRKAEKQSSLATTKSGQDVLFPHLYAWMRVKVQIWALIAYGSIATPMILTCRFIG